jgi:1D-myo-inositol-triphosphate 3-kinase
MIDFAHCIAHQDCNLTHRKSWQAGNHEDGYLFGIDNLIRIWEEMGTNGTLAEPAPG